MTGSSKRRDSELAARRPNLKTTVADHVRGLIFSGALRPGDKIDQDAIAEHLGMSKLPVREALIALESESLLENVARRGSFVSRLEPEDIRDHYRIYGLVSGLAASRAAELMTDDQLEELRCIKEQMESLAALGPERPDELVELEELNFEFHRTINRTGSSRLVSALRSLSHGIPAGFYEFSAGWASMALVHHHEIFTALVARNETAAQEAMTRHLHSSGEHAVGLLQSSGFWKPNGSIDDALAGT